VSLLPLTLEYGLNQSACTKTAKTLSIVPQFSHEGNSDEEEEGLDGSEESRRGSENQSILYASRHNRRTLNTQEKDQLEDNTDLVNTTKVYYRKVEEDVDVDIRRKKEPMDLTAPDSKPVSPLSPQCTTNERAVDEEALGLGLVDKCEEVPDFLTAVQMKPAEAGLPLALFKKVINFVIRKIAHRPISRHTLLKCA